MGINFPSAPAVDQLYPQPPVAGLPVYRWDGQKWTTQGASATKTPVYTDGSTPMTAQLKLFGSPPVATNDAVPKSYVDGAAVRYDTAQALTAAQAAQARANIGALKKNYFLNGAMMISQENGATAGAPASGNTYYPVDQFYVVVNLSGGAFSIAQVVSPTPGGSPNRIRVTVTTAQSAMAAANYVFIRQYVEGVRVADLKFGAAAAKQIVLQFGVRAPAGTHCVQLQNGALNRCYIAEVTIAAGEANTDVVRSIALPGDVTGTWATDNTPGLAVNWMLAVGSAQLGAAGAWQAGNLIATTNQFNLFANSGNVFELFDVGLYEGAVAPPFQVPDYPGELLACQRHYQVSGQLTGTWYSAASLQAYAALAPPMRAAPTVTIKNATGVVNDINIGTFNITSLGGSTAAPLGLNVNLNTNATAAASFKFGNVSPGALAFNARM